MKKICFGFLFILFSLNGFAKHIVGGEIFYDCLGNNNYRISLKLYRDCYSSQGAPYDDPASVGVFDSSGTLVMNLQVVFPGSDIVPNSINNPCIIPPTNICLEEAVYTATVNLPPIPGGYDITYQRCCRNLTISNIANNPGSTYTCHIPDQSLAVCNSSPRFNNFPPVFLCANEPIHFDHSATDPDGDSLVYEFADPFEGASAFNPQPNPPPAPPYSNITWVPPYNLNYQMSASPALTLDSKSGLLTGAPNMIGQWVVGIRVKEYRNKQLISVNTRDFQFNVIACNYAQVSSIPSQTTFCFGMTVHFLNASLNATTYFWDFGDPSVTNDTSSLVTPVYTYSQPGTYKVMLVVNPGWRCADTSYTTFVINPLLDPNFVPGAPQCFSGNNFKFSAAGSYQGNGTFLWDFGTNATPQTSTLQNISNVTFNAAGNYPVTLTVTENGCTKSFSSIVQVLPEPILTYNPPPLTGCVPFTVQFSDSTFKDTSVTQVLWNFGDGTTSSQNNPIHTYSMSGVYAVSVTINSNNFCVGNVTYSIPKMITVNPSPMAGLNASPTTVTVVDPTVTFTDMSHGSSNCWIYFGDGDSSNNCNSTHTYDVTDTYTVSQMVENQYGCKDYYELKIVSDIFSFWIPNAFTPNLDDKNEVFGPVVRGVQNFHFLIFDRWGNRIFESYEPMKGWDGTLKGKPCQEDIYVWKIDFEKAGEHNIKRNYLGHVNLVK